MLLKFPFSSPTKIEVIKFMLQPSYYCSNPVQTFALHENILFNTNQSLTLLQNPSKYGNKRYTMFLPCNLRSKVLSIKIHINNSSILKYIGLTLAKKYNCFQDS